MKINTENLEERITEAVAAFWLTRERQKVKQDTSNRSDQDGRRAVTGGAQMDGFISLFTELLQDAEVDVNYIHYKKSLDLPGFFRPTKEWDLLVVRDSQLILALEVKSQVGPSFGNNFNNRTEEAIGSALDLWTAFREGAFNSTVRPWLGYLFLLEDNPQSQKPVRNREPHFEVFSEFKGASYARRYELFCRKLVREGYYNSAALVLSEQERGLNGSFHEPAEDLTCKIFIRSMLAHAMAFGKE